MQTELTTKIIQTELPTWALADVLLGFIDYDIFVQRIRAFIPEYADHEAVARNLERWLADDDLHAVIEEGPYDLGLIVGDYAAGKTGYVLTRLSQHAQLFDGCLINAVAPNPDDAAAARRDVLEDRLPQDCIERSKNERVALLKNNSTIQFLNYWQDIDGVLEGGPRVGDPQQRGRCLGFVTTNVAPPMEWLRRLAINTVRYQAVGIVEFSPSPPICNYPQIPQIVEYFLGKDSFYSPLVQRSRKPNRRIVIHFDGYYGFKSREQYVKSAQPIIT